MQDLSKSFLCICWDNYLLLFNPVSDCDPMDCSMPVSSVLHCLPEFAQIHVHWVSDAIQPSPSKYIHEEKFILGNCSMWLCGLESLKSKGETSRLDILAGYSHCNLGSKGGLETEFLPFRGNLRLFSKNQLIGLGPLT